MRDFSESSTVSDIVAHHPSTSAVFDKHKIDFCCGGAISLKSACHSLHIEPTVLLDELEKASDAGVEAAERDWSKEENVDFIVEYIIKKYHNPLRMDLKGIAGILQKVARVHGDRHPELRQMEPIFQGLSDELTTHLMKEEHILFPYMRAIHEAWSHKNALPTHHCGTVQNPIHQMEEEHQDAGKALAMLRTISKDYKVPDDGCASYKALFRGLEKIENDLHRHIHLENYVLHPLVTRMAQELKGVQT